MRRALIGPRFKHGMRPSLNACALHNHSDYSGGGFNHVPVHETIRNANEIVPKQSYSNMASILGGVLQRKRIATSADTTFVHIGVLTMKVSAFALAVLASDSI